MAYRIVVASPDKKYKVAEGPCSCCGKEVRKELSTRRNGALAENIYCDRSCYDKHREKIAAARKSKGVDCKECGVFVPRVHDGKNGQKVYCSMACRNKSVRPGANKCVNCGWMFTPIAWRSNGRYIVAGSRKTCSDKCLKSFYKNDQARKDKISKAFTGSKHPAWRGGPEFGKGRSYRGQGWPEIAEAARKRDNHKCQDCGITQEDHGKKLDVHHITPFSQFRGDSAKANRMRNLISLCTSCHKIAEAKWNRENPYQLSMDVELARDDKESFQRYWYVANGKKYSKLARFAEVLGTSKTTARRRCESDKHPNIYREKYDPVVQ